MQVVIAIHEDGSREELFIAEPTLNVEAWASYRQHELTRRGIVRVESAPYVPL